MTEMLPPTPYDDLVKTASEQLTIWTLFGILAAKLPKNPQVKNAFFEFGEALLVYQKNDYSN